MDLLPESFGDDAPSGENLEYETVFTELERESQPGEERQMGDEVIAAEPPDDRKIIEIGNAVLAQSHDLRAAVMLAAAELRMNGFPGFAGATRYLRTCLETFWDTCHPQLDADDDNDPTMRVNAVLGLADDSQILRGLRNAPLTLSQSFGRVTLRDIAVAEGEIAAPADGSATLDAAGIAAAFKDTDPDTLRGIHDAAAGALEDVKQIDAVFGMNTPGQGPDLSALIKTLYRAVKRLGDEVGADTAETGEGEADMQDDAGAPVAKTGGAPGAINSPRDVEAALDRIIAYYAAHEPSSPLPVLLGRARRLVGADFMTIMKDMAPGGVDNVMLVGGIEE